MGNKKKGKKGKKQGEAPSAEQVRGERSVDPARVEGYERLMIVEERLYELWEQRNGGGMNWVGEALGSPVDEDMTLWLAAVGDKVAALGGHLELNAVFPAETVTPLQEPGLNPPGGGSESA